MTILQSIRLAAVLIPGSLLIGCEYERATVSNDVVAQDQQDALVDDQSSVAESNNASLPEVAAQRKSAVSFKLSQQDGQREVVVSNVNPQSAATLLVHAISGADAEVDADVPAMLGRVKQLDGQLIFKPRFGFQPGQFYRATLSTNGSSGTDPLTWQFEVPQPKTMLARVSHVYPSGQSVPENLLRIYIHFSEPMSRGYAYKCLRLLDADGKHIEAAFLELHEELWDADGKRFTLLFDPGRVKKGLRPREESGAVLQAGQNYTLVIDKSWRDATGREMAHSQRKSFTVTAADTVQPDPAKWKVTPPADANGFLRVRFREPLDYAQLQHMISVNVNNTEVDGHIRVLENETVWQFQPDVWPTGTCELVVDSRLEDRCGNSPGRPFEFDLDSKRVSVPAMIRLRVKK